MPFGPAGLPSNQLGKSVGRSPGKVEQEIRQAPAESQGLESKKRFDGPGRSAGHRVPTVHLLYSCPFLHRAYQPFQPAFPQSVARQA